MKYVSFVVCVLLAHHSSSQRNASISFEKWISLKTVGSPVISPDGETVVYSVSSTDWPNNSYHTALWWARDGSAAVQLTRTAKNSSTTPRFTPDNKFVSFLADRGEKSQIYIISISGGEAIQVTKDEDGINGYEWSPDGSKILYAKSETDTKQDKTIKERFGAFGVEGEEYKQTHLWLLNFSYDSILLAGQTPCYTIKKDSSNTDSLIKLKQQNCYSLPVATSLTK